MKPLQTSFANSIDATDGKVKYDIQVKRVVSNKWILAWKLKYTVKEFAGYDLSDITKCIEGLFNMDLYECRKECQRFHCRIPYTPQCIIWQPNKKMQI